MWRRNIFKENEDSDQSISEEDEDLDGNWIEHTISLGGAAENKGGLQVLSQLDILRDSHKVRSADTVSISSPERKAGLYIDEEIENPFFNDESGACCSSEGIMHLPAMPLGSHYDEEIISDDEKLCPNTHENAEDNVYGTWSEANREVEALVCLQENVGSSSSHAVYMRDNKSSKGGSKAKGREKLSFHFQSRNKDLSLIVNDVNENIPLDNFPVAGDEAYGDMDIVVAESQIICSDNEFEQPLNMIMPSRMANKLDSEEHSMAEFLDCFQERSGLLRESLETDVNRRGRRDKMVGVRNMFPFGRENLGDDVDDVDDLPEALIGGPPSPCDDENLLLLENPQSPKSTISKTIADQFHDALGIMSVIDERPTIAFPGPLCSGLFGKLQQVIQIEKERDTLYLKNLSSEPSYEDKDERISLCVRILSSSLEAKLTVCSCTCIGDEEENKDALLLQNSYSENYSEMAMKSVGRTLTVIFSPRICSDIELEVGNLIRIHPPWKEVQVKGNDEVVILCSYFSQVPS